MSKQSYILLLAALSLNTFGQTQHELFDKYYKNELLKFNAGSINSPQPGTFLSAPSGKNQQQFSPGTFFRLKEKQENINSERNGMNSVQLIDTLRIGLTPNDTLRITGTYNHNGPIWVMGTGVLIIKNANVTNLGGDLILFGNGHVFVDSSIVTFPQSYFYQRSITMVQNTVMKISNSTLNYGGFQHSLSILNNASMSMYHVTQPDWMTTGLSGKASLSINGTNQAGEFIVMDTCSLNLKNCTNSIIWHHFSSTAMINWSFGKKDSAYNYRFDNTQTGVSGLNYSVKADSCYHIMWALMPSSYSNVTINNSKIRAIGVWFDTPNDSVNVSGLINNSNYTNFTAPLSEHTLTINNSSVQTWSLYQFNKTRINVTGCIAGEIGSYGKSKFYGSSYVVDGSGGYHYSSDTSTCIASGLTANTVVRSEKSGFFLVGYSNVNQSASAINKALLIVAQTPLPNPPGAVDGGCAWYNHINYPAALYVDSSATINGWSFIANGPNSAWMRYKHHRLFYQKVGNTTWTPISPIDTNQIWNATLAAWNTHGLATGNYIIKQTITDSWGNNVDAQVQVNLLAKILASVNSPSFEYEIKLHPNPVSEQMDLVFSPGLSTPAEIKIMDVLGNEITQFTCAESSTQINTSKFSNGLYFVTVKCDRESFVKKILVQHE